MTITEELESDPSKIVEMLKQQYESVFSSTLEEMRVNNSIQFFNTVLETTDQLSSVEVIKTHIISAIEKISPSSAAGPNGFYVLD